MISIVVDASVAAKWFLPTRGETLVDEAFHLFQQYAKGQLQFFVPDLFWAELANVLWKAVRLGRCEKETAQMALIALRDRKLPTVSTLSLLEVAFAVATAFDRTVYDALYVALAVQLHAQFVTADEKLANTLAAHLPVKWLGAM